MQVEDRVIGMLATAQLAVYVKLIVSAGWGRGGLVRMQSDREQRVRQRAYAIWEDEGRPYGRDVEHWLRAEAEIVPIEEMHDAMMEFGFDRFRAEYPKMESHSATTECTKFAIGEFGRFRSIAGTVLQSFDHVSTNISERILTHILLRSCLENYFWLLYIFDSDKASWDAKYGEYVNDFKIQYARLYREPSLPHKSKIESPDPSWSNLPRTKDLNSLLITLHNSHGNRLNFLYFLYRITSFDTHGKSLPALFQTVFGKVTNFPYLRIDVAIDVMANGYLVIWEKIKAA